MDIAPSPVSPNQDIKPESRSLKIFLSNGFIQQPQNIFPNDLFNCIV